MPLLTRSGGLRWRCLPGLDLAKGPLGLVALLAVGGCQAAGPTELAGPVYAPPVLASPEPATPDSVFRTGFDRIDEVYFEPVDFGQLSVDGLKGLTALDDGFGVERDGGQLALLESGQTLATFAAPPADDSRAWADVVAAAVRQARAQSAALGSHDSEDIYEAVFSAVTADLDPYSRYVSAERARQERAARDGYGGIGLLLEYDDQGRALVDEVFPGGPAELAGIRAGDIILTVDGVPASTLDVAALGDRLRGEVDTHVDVALLSPDGTVRTVHLTRARVIQNVVTTRIEDGIAIIRISRFNAATTRDVTEAVEQAEAQLGPRPRGIILDLRGNPGGLLDQSVAVADLFVDSGELISTRGRHPDSSQEFFARAGDIANGVPLVVLVDGHSASGSEVAAAALQDTGRAVVVGSSSYGKGSVQTVTRLPNDGELFLTWSRIFAPSGYTLHLQGVLPTICTSKGPDAPDQLIDAFRAGQLALPTDLAGYRMAAPEDEQALSTLRAACPWQAHDEQLDVLVAEKFIEDPTLYAQALEASRHPQLAQSR